MSHCFTPNTTPCNLVTCSAHLVLILKEVESAITSNGCLWPRKECPYLLPFLVISDGREYLRAFNASGLFKASVNLKFWSMYWSRAQAKNLKPIHYLFGGVHHMSMLWLICSFKNQHASCEILVWVTLSVGWATIAYSLNLIILFLRMSRQINKQYLFPCSFLHLLLTLERKCQYFEFIPFPLLHFQWLRQGQSW